MRFARSLFFVCLVACLSGCGSGNATLENVLKTHKYDVGWAAGSANLDDENKLTLLPAEVTVKGDKFHLEYPYYEGKVDGMIAGKEVTATWTQNGPGRLCTGEFYIKFKDNFSQGEGWWKDSVDQPLIKHKLIMNWRTEQARS